MSWVEKVTWAAAKDGLVSIYVDGLLRKKITSGKTAPLPDGGTIVLGNDQGDILSTLLSLLYVHV